MGLRDWQGLCYIGRRERRAAAARRPATRRHIMKNLRIRSLTKIFGPVLLTTALVLPVELLATPSAAFAAVKVEKGEKKNEKNKNRNEARGRGQARGPQKEQVQQNRGQQRRQQVQA